MEAVAASNTKIVQKLQSAFRGKQCWRKPTYLPSFGSCVTFGQSKQIRRHQTCHVVLETNQAEFGIQKGIFWRLGMQYQPSDRIEQLNGLLRIPNFRKFWY